MRLRLNFFEEEEEEEEEDSMGELKAECRFNAVGQGLFYTGIITKVVDRKVGRFSFVYDCGVTGSSKQLNKEIDNFWDVFPKSIKKKLDLLVISHFDVDHISGMTKLLTDTALDTVVIPYISLVRRLIYLGNPELSDDLSLFYENPIEYFRSKGAKRIIVIFGGDDEDEFEAEHREPGEEGISFERKIGEDAPMEVLKVRINVTLSSGDFDWKFMFFNKENKSDIASQIAEVNAIISMSPEDALRDEEVRKKLRAKYVDIGDVNDTSVVMCHKPINPAYTTFDGAAFFDYGHLGHYWGCAETLLTGDINLQKYFDELIKHIPAKPLVLSVPHHGSHKNWNPEILKCFERCLCVCVASYGVSNQYGHPSFKVLENIRFSEWNHIFCGVTQRKSFTYTIFVKN